MLVIVLYLMPKVVVDNEQQEDAETIGESSLPDLSESHDRQLTEDELAIIGDLKDGFDPELNPEKKC